MGRLTAFSETRRVASGAAEEKAGLRRLRALLMSSVTIGALCLAGGEANAACVDGPVNVRTCTGDVSTGVLANFPIDTLLVNSLSANIAPTANTDGIAFSDVAALTLTSDTDAFQITTTGTGIGVDVVSVGSSVLVNHTGDISSQAGGIYASALTTLDLTFNGNVTAVDDAIAGFADNAVTIGSIGNLTSTAGSGITAASLLAGDVGVTSTGNINAALTAIDAQSADGIVTVISTGNLISTGGGGISAVAGGLGNDVTVVSGGNISVAAGSSAIYAEALGGGDVDVTINSGSTVVGGSTLGAAGVSIVGGSTNTLNNAGTLSGAGGWAIIAGTGDDSVTNTGIVTGDVDLGTGTNPFINAATGQLRSGDVLNVGPGNLVTNNGIIAPGGANTLQTTGVVGDLNQTGTGHYNVDLNTATGASDLLTVSGTATLAGTIVPNLVNRSLTDKDMVILSAGVTLTDGGLTVADTAAYNYGLIFSGNDLRLTIQLLSINALVASPLTPNQQATVDYMDTLLATPGLNANMVLFLDAVGGLATEAEIVAALDRLNPQHYAATVASTLFGSQQFANSLMSCPSPQDPRVVNKESECYWAQLRGRTTDWDTTRTNIGGNEDAGGVTGGMQAFVAQDLLAGGAISYEHSSVDTDNLASSDGDRFSAGMVLKALYGDTVLAGSVFGGLGSFDTTRFVLPGVTAHGDEDIDFAGAALRLSHTYEQGYWYLKPILDAGATYVSYGGFSETGAGVANLVVQDENQWVLNLGAALEIGSMMIIQPGLFARPYVRAGVTALSDTDFSLTSSFAGAPAGVAPFTVTTSYDDLFADLSAGIDVFASSGLSVNMAYDGRFGDHTTSHAASAKLRVAF